MSKSQAKKDWWENALYLGLFLLIAVFIYQLLQLWNSGSKTLGNLLSAIPQAFDNAIAAVESALSTAITSPISFISGLFNAIPNFLGLVTNFFATIFTGNAIGTIIGGVAGSLGTSTANNPPVVTNGQGSSYSGYQANPIFLDTPPTESPIAGAGMGETFTASGGGE